MDVLQRIDIFETFRKTSTKTFVINPLCIYNLPGSAWKVGLEIIEVNYTSGNVIVRKNVKNRYFKCNVR